MANIKTYLNNIKTAVFGSEVRDSIHDAIQQCYDDASAKDNANMEVKMARGEYENLGKRLDSHSSQIKEKANDNEVRKKNVLINEFDISDSLRQQINGNAPIHQTIGDKSITENKTTFFKTGKNLFNKETCINGQLISTNDGTLVANSNYTTSDYIFIEPYEYIFTPGYTTRYALYDSNKTFLESGISDTIPKNNNASYVRISFETRALTNNIKLQLEKGTVNTYYEDYKCLIPYELISSHTHDINELIGQLNEESTAFFDKSNNLFNKEMCSSGFVGGANGNEYTHDTYWKTDYIKIKPNTTYSANEFYVSNQCCYFDENKTYISIVTWANNKFTTPSNAKYVRFSIKTKNDIETAILNEGDILLPYDEYGFKLKEKYLKDNNNIVIPIINLPYKLYALVGQEFNINFDNIIEGKDTDYQFNVDCEVGKQYEDFYRLTPTAEGEYNFTLNVLKHDKLLISSNSTIIVSDKSKGNGITRKVMVLGDSTVANGIMISKLNDNFSTDVMNIETIGTQGSGINKHEGRSGWSFKIYTEFETLNNISNPFYNPTTETFDYSYYLTNTGLDKPDYFIINLGINDTVGYITDTLLEGEIDNIFIRMDKVINSIKSVDNNIKIGIAITIPPNYSQDAFGIDYNCGQTRDRAKRNNVIWNSALMDRFKDRESENIYLIPINCNLDTKHNFGLEEVQVNARNTFKKYMPTKNSGVHPSESGYWQIADSYWYFIKSFES